MKNKVIAISKHHDSTIKTSAKLGFYAGTTLASVIKFGLVAASIKFVGLIIPIYLLFRKRDNE